MGRSPQVVNQLRPEAERAESGLGSASVGLPMQGTPSCTNEFRRSAGMTVMQHPSTPRALRSNVGNLADSAAEPKPMRQV